jgi:CRP/FNR family transcriptional regulator, dissimilatory nitrate respiration regulator
VIEALRADPALAEAFMARLARQLHDLRARMELRNIRSVCERILQYPRLRAGHGRTIVIEGQLQDIAAEIGMTREALYRTLVVLEAEGHLTRTETAILLKKSNGA